jgi:nitrate reductase NapD
VQRLRRLREFLSRLGNRNGWSGGRVVIDDLVHISSAVVSVLPAHRDVVATSLAALPEVEVHHADASKIVIVMEAPETGALGARLAEIAGWSGVLSANMVFECVARRADIGD